MSLRSLFRSLFATGGEISITGPARPIDLAPAEVVQEKPVRRHQERIIAGMGSGDSSDINTYAKFDALPEAEKAKIRARSQLPRMRDRKTFGANDMIEMEQLLEKQSLESPPKPIDANTIADVMDKKYVRDMKTGKLVLKDGLPMPDPNLGKDYE